MTIQTAPIKWLIIGLSATLLGILSLIWTPFEIAMEERLRMRPGFPPFDWWYEPPDVIRLRVYLFNVTNAERYMNGEDENLHLEEIGPIVFREVVTHKDVVFNDNGTMSYTVHRNAIWDPSLNTIDLNATMMYPNLPVLLTASMFWNCGYFMKLLINSAFKVTNSQPIVQKTIYEILYNNTDPFLSIAHLTMPSIAMHTNVGLIPLIYPGYGNRMNVFVGTRYGHRRYLLIDKFNGSRYIPGRGKSCQDNLQNSNNNIMYTQLISKSDTIRIFNNLMCRKINLVYQEEVYRQGFKAYKFVLDHDAYNRTTPSEDDCYKSSPPLTDGLTDLAPCWFQYPVVGSYPHFLYGNEKLQSYVKGMKPNVTKHRSYGIFEPITGIVLDSMASMQINIYVKPLVGFHKIFERFSDIVIPVFCLETSHDHVPDYVVAFMRGFLLLPTIGTILSVILLILGTFSAWQFQRRILNRQKQGSREEILKTNEACDADKEEYLRAVLLDSGK